VTDEEAAVVVEDEEQEAALGADPDLAEVELPDRVAARRLEARRMLVTLRPCAGLLARRRRGGPGEPRLRPSRFGLRLLSLSLSL
jgi:hypothetical protein